MRRRALFLLGTLLVAVGAFLGRDFFQEHVAPELLYTAWQVYVLVDTIPQIILWGMLMALLIVLAARSLRRDREPSPAGFAGRISRPGRVGGLARSLRLMESSRYVRLETLRDLDRLAVEALVQGNRRGRAAIEQAWAGGELDVDPAVRDFLAPARRGGRNHRSPALPVTGRFSRLARWRRDVTTWLQQRRGRHSRPLDPRLEKTVRFLEQAIDE